MKFILSEQSIKEADDTIAVFAHENGSVVDIDIPQVASSDFKGKDGQLTLVYPSGNKQKRIFLVGLGKTIEILNTDAEGRVVLADALYFASKLNPDCIIDVATLTGACFVALGNEASGLMGNDRSLIEALKKSGEATYERVWEFPMYEEYADLIISDFADVKNITSNSPVPSGAGAITAAKFLENFVNGKWAHIDIAGTDWSDTDQGYKPKGATGVGVRLLVNFLANL